MLLGGDPNNTCQRNVVMEEDTIFGLLPMCIQCELLVFIHILYSVVHYSCYKSHLWLQRMTVPIMQGHCWEHERVQFPEHTTMKSNLVNFESFMYTIKRTERPSTKLWWNECDQLQPWITISILTANSSAWLGGFWPISLLSLISVSDVIAIASRNIL